MSDDLIAELRLNDSEIYLPLLGKAADRIEALEARVAGLTHERDFHRETADLHAEDIAALQAENERFRSVLRYYTDRDDYGERARAALGDKA